MLNMPKTGTSKKVPHKFHGAPQWLPGIEIKKTESGIYHVEL